MIPNLYRINDSCPASPYRRPVPECWTLISRQGALDMWEEPGGLAVSCSRDRMEDGRWWLHVGVSRAARIPSWDDLKRVKDEFIGRNHEAVQVLPSDRDYVNLHPYCLHLWSPEEEAH